MPQSYHPARSRSLPRRTSAASLAALLVALAGTGLAAVGEPSPWPGTQGDGPYRECAAEVGLRFVHVNGMTGALHFPEMTGQGGALFDYDGDGDLDVYLVQGGELGPSARREYSDRLFRNDLDAARGPTSLHFTDVTDASKIVATGYGMGVAVGDIDNDGHPDLYVTNFGPNQLLRNRGDGTFADETVSSGTGDASWSVSATFLDYDRDGWLDLYVANYVGWSIEHPARCFMPSGRRDYCGPSGFQPLRDRLYRNRGDGTFADVSEVTRIAARPGPGLGVIAADLDDDGWTDLYVANDGAANFLFFNAHDGTFREDALFAGVALNLAGRPEASMGIAAGDADGDGDPDLFLTHLRRETNTLYLNDGAGIFHDATLSSGLGPPSFPNTGFGTRFVDVDNDGRLDIFVANGEVRLSEAQVEAGDAYPLKQRNQLFRNAGGHAFEETRIGPGPAGSALEVSRGLAAGDVDNDGDIDLLVCNSAGPVRLLRNEIGQSSPWLGLRLLDSAGHVAVGGRATLRRRDAPELVRWSTTDGSYASASDPRIVFGLGGGRTIETIDVVWPDGARESFPIEAIDRYLDIRQGNGVSLEQPPR